MVGCEGFRGGEGVFGDDGGAGEFQHRQVVQGMDDETSIFERHLAPETVRGIISFCHARGWYVNWCIGREVCAEYYAPKWYFFTFSTVKVQRPQVISSFSWRKSPFMLSSNPAMVSTSDVWSAKSFSSVCVIS